MDLIPEEKQVFINEFLGQPLIARVATADEEAQPHVVPVWYGWDGKSMWISSYSNTRKVTDLQENAKIAVSIDVSGDQGGTRAVIFEGKAELVREPRQFLEKQFEWIYARYLGEYGVKAEDPQRWIKDPHNLLIKLTPDVIYTWQW